MVRAASLLGADGSGIYMGSLSNKDVADPESKAI
jgi:hypothetical protein